MLTQIDSVTHSIHGLTGSLHEDYRADVTDIQNLGRGWRRIFLSLSDDMPKPAGAVRKPRLYATVVAHESVEDYRAYRVELWRRIQGGGLLEDVAL
jgi:hypothetical protein